jgi:hypothetical protein
LILLSNEFIDFYQTLLFSLVLFIISYIVTAFFLGRNMGRDSDYRSRRRSRSRDRDADRYKSSRDKDYERKDRERSRDNHYEKDRSIRKRSRSRSPKDIKPSSSSKDRRKKDIPIQERRRQMSMSSTSSEEEQKDREFDEKLEILRKEKAEKRRLQKQKIKETETPEEKRIRRMAKKMRKEEKRKTESLSDVIAYNNLNNPFNDSNLTQPFVWGKKLQKEGKEKLSNKEIEKMHLEKVNKNIREMEELRKNRDIRRMQKEDDEMMARDRERQMYGDFGVVEYKFHIKQAKERTKIRLKENRPKPIDLLVRYSAYSVPGEEEQYGEFELVDPLTYIKGLSIDDFEDLIADIKTYKKIASHKDDEFWDDLRTIAEGEVTKLKDARRRAEMDEVVHSSVKKDVIKTFQNKNYDELVKLEADVQNKIRTETNVGFWQYLLDELRPYMAKSRLKSKHVAKQTLKLQRIREEQAKEMDEHQKLLGDVKPILPSKSATESKPDDEEMEIDTKNDSIYTEITKEDEIAIRKQTFKSIPFTFDELKAMDDDVQEQKWSSLTEAQLELFTENMYNQGRYSPVLGGDNEAMPGIEVIDEVDDFKQLQAARKRNRESGAEPMTSAEAEFMRMARSGMEKEEEEFVDEEKLEKQTYLWSDKYRPRKPRYFNRVHTGFDWNKYNQTHYDLDNPPPKIVQGYRFNIFYPDLLDITHTPQYTLTECEDPDFAILRFKAGPPYEDIAFKIVNREWEINHKHGFRNQFKEGVFQLWFFFKRYRYRRLIL